MVLNSSEMSSMNKKAFKNLSWTKEPGKEHYHMKSFVKPPVEKPASKDLVRTEEIRKLFYRKEHLKSLLQTEGL